MSNAIPAHHVPPFQKFAHWTARATGTSIAFIAAIAVLALWGATGPIFHFSDTWQLVINTGTTIVTFLMVFLIQNTQNRETAALHIKLDELIRAVKGAHNERINLDELSQADLDKLVEYYNKLAAKGGQDGGEEANDRSRP